ncbi:DeoR/GlpR transcriptional regulator [Verrucomicrobia bacterium LW23]|nr:DeoR/GlpR transcriptional regulator [Verrucomicrobia bacterium LW23]
MIAQRRRHIVAWVRDHGSARVADLSRQFGVSEVTIRNDLARLEDEGLLIRDRGGAIPAAEARPVTSLLQVDKRSAIRVDEKKRIAASAARLVRPGDTIIMDAGTTVVEMTPHLAAVPDITVVTNALNVALQVSAATAGTSARVLLLGGFVNRSSSSTLGSFAERALAELRVDKLFLGTQAFDRTHGLTDTTMEIAEIKRAMIRSAREVILLADSAKWASAGFIKVAPLSAVHKLCTDSALPEDAQSALRQLGVELMLS